MSSSVSHEIKVSRALRQWWKDGLSNDGLRPTLRRFVSAMWEFGIESMPERRRQRFGDVEYDWDFRVNTTSATVGWRDCLLGHFHSPYQPTEPALFHEMLGSLKIDFREFTFIDLGSGKGRALLMASDYPFRRILGVELLPELHRGALENIRAYKSDSQQCFKMESVCADASDFAFPPEPTVLYLFNPFPESGLIKVIAALERSLRENPRSLYVLYHNRILERVLERSTLLKKVSGTNQYAVYSNSAIS